MSINNLEIKISNYFNSKSATHLKSLTTNIAIDRILFKNYKS
ncbi:hypothetical protein KsCSTR_21220 [Candidatus Kuenenia stuttgartiensis]|uniref:Uncharacterized protein n=1 Tax=Kuenenia stuttgartiensis TaxID=174633 RepID=A0A6G7GPY9_KUEST|nr:hypothetical protein KsCSTR_21220 [Candidatus Kuenenia stuttgartiensis]